jgi:hypothetical protein
MPAAVSSKSVKTYYKQSGSPVHKEWGEGVRFTGCSVLGKVRQQSGSPVVFEPAVPQQEDFVADDFIRHYDLFTSMDTGLAGIIMSLHPAFVTRLQNECRNWGEYCYRSVRLHSGPQAGTDVDAGWTAGASHDVAWPLDLDQATSIDPTEIAELGTHDNGAFYESFDMRMADFKGDRTWSTTLPVVDIGDASITSPPGSFIWPMIESSYQNFFAILGNQNGGSEYFGLVYITYTIDFYSVKSDQTFLMQSISWINGPQYGLHGTTGKRIRDTFPSPRRKRGALNQPRPSQVVKLESLEEKIKSDTKDEKSDVKDLTPSFEAPVAVQVKPLISMFESKRTARQQAQAKLKAESEAALSNWDDVSTETLEDIIAQRRKDKQLHCSD